MHDPANFSLAAKSLDLWLSTPESASPPAAERVRGPPAASTLPRCCARS